MPRAGTRTGVQALAPCSLTRSRQRFSRLRHGPHPERGSRGWRKLSTFGEHQCLATPTTWPIWSQATRFTSWLSRMIAGGRRTGPAVRSRTDRRDLRVDPRPATGSSNGTTCGRPPRAVRWRNAASASSSSQAQGSAATGGRQQEEHLIRCQAVAALPGPIATARNIIAVHHVLFAAVRCGAPVR